MTITFTPDNWYLGLWYVAPNDTLPLPERCDWMGGIWRPLAGGPWSIAYRFRYYQSADPFGTDRKSWYNGTAPAATTRDHLLGTLDVVLQTYSTLWQSWGDRLLLECPGDGVWGVLTTAKKPWLHIARQEGS